MKKTPPRWPHGSGQWNRLRTTLIACEDPSAHVPLDGSSSDMVRVLTLLDMVAHLEDEQQLITTLVLAGALADDPEITRVLHELYPMVDVIHYRNLGR